ncbi:MAG: YIP1 family protein [Candidatus Diapherotrites archaeon]|nr:YIP1 family protein [Candidatus Diapherotrites archaeon]
MGFFDVLLKPNDVFPAEKPNASMGKAVKRYAVYGLVTGLIAGIILFFVLGALTSIVGPAAGGLLDNPLVGAGLGALGIVGIVLLVIFSVIWTVIWSAIAALVIWIVSKALGGTGEFKDNYYLLSLPLWPVLAGTLVLGIVSVVLVFIPVLGWLLIGLIWLAWIVYMLYVTVTAVSVANGFSKLKALGVMVILFVVWMIISFATGLGRFTPVA